MSKYLFISLALLCSACAIGPDYERKVFYDDDKIANELSLKNSQKNVSSDWFKIFGDSYLNELIDLALKNSPTINAAKEKLHQARYKLYMSEADLLPAFDIGGEYVKSSPAEVIEPLAKQDYYQVGFDASWEIDIWGGNRRLIESNRAMLKAVGADFNNVKLVLISEVAAKYVSWKMYQKLIADTNANIENQMLIFETIKSKYEAGLVDTLTFNQAESLVKTTRQKLPSFVLNEKNMRNALGVLVGVLPSQIENRQSTILENELNFDMNNLYDLSAKIVQSRPDVFSAEQNLAAQNALIGNKMSNLLPSLSLKAFLGFQNDTLSPIFSKDYNMYSNSVQSLMPLFHWGKIINDIKAQQSATKEALNNYQAALLQAVADISNSIASVEENSKNYNLANENFTLFADIAELSQTKYDNGLISFNDFLDAQNNLISAQIAKSQAKASLYDGIISFYKAVGGGLNSSYNAQDGQTDSIKPECEPCKD